MDIGSTVVCQIGDLPVCLLRPASSNESDTRVNYIKKMSASYMNMTRACKVEQTMKNLSMTTVLAAAFCLAGAGALLTSYAQQQTSRSMRICSNTFHRWPGSTSILTGDYVWRQKQARFRFLQLSHCT